MLSKYLDVDMVLVYLENDAIDPSYNRISQKSISVLKRAVAKNNHIGPQAQFQS